GKPKLRPLPHGLLLQLRDADDRYILASLSGAEPDYLTYAHGGHAASYYSSAPEIRRRLVPPLLELLMPMLCRTGRCRFRMDPRDDESRWLTLQWDDGEPWQFRLDVRRADQAPQYEVRGALTRGSERIDLATPSLLTSSGLVFLGEHVARYEHRNAFNWVKALREQQTLSVPVEQGDEFVDILLRLSALPALDLPEELSYEEAAVTPRPRLTVKPSPESWQSDRLRGSLSFDYDGSIIDDDHPGAVVLKERRRVLLRDHECEQTARERLFALGLRELAGGYEANPGFEFPASRLPRIVHELLTDGWRIEALGKLYRAPGRF